MAEKKLPREPSTNDVIIIIIIVVTIGLRWDWVKRRLRIN